MNHSAQERFSHVPFSRSPAGLVSPVAHSQGGLSPLAGACVGAWAWKAHWLAGVCSCGNAGGWPWEHTHTFSGEEHLCGEEKTETVSLSKESSAKHGDLFNLFKILATSSLKWEENWHPLCRFVIKDTVRKCEARPAHRHHPSYGQD